MLFLRVTAKRSSRGGHLPEECVVVAINREGIGQLSESVFGVRQLFSPTTIGSVIPMRW